MENSASYVNLARPFGWAKLEGGLGHSGKKPLRSSRLQQFANAPNWISEDVSAEVGGIPHVATLLNDKPGFNWLPDHIISKQGDLAKNCKSNLWPCFADQSMTAGQGT